MLSQKESLEALEAEGYSYTGRLYAFKDLDDNPNYRVVFGEWLHEDTEKKPLHIVVHTTLRNIWPVGERFGYERILTYKDLVPVEYEELSLIRLAGPDWEGYNHEVLCTSTKASTT